MDTLEGRLRVQLRRAFFDLLEDRLAAQDKQEAVLWLIRLHDELRQRFSAVLPSRAQDISERLDTQLFAQQIKAGAYGSEQLGPLIDYTWSLLRMACAPDMDDAVQKSYNEVASALVPGAAFSKVVPLYLKHAHGQLDEIIRRIEELRPEA
tara:strand:- start:33 stop:485 length:453 start_codon:yes stop_codon:yes gene_type:complete